MSSLPLPARLDRAARPRRRGREGEARGSRRRVRRCLGLRRVQRRLVHRPRRQRDHDPPPVRALSRRHAPMSRAELLERYRALPMPTTTDESWRFTDLKGFDPEAFVQNGHAHGTGPRTMLEIDVSGLATVDGGGIEIESAPDGIRFELLDEAHPQLGELVGADEKFAAQNAAQWKHGLLVHVPKGVVLEQPLYVRIANPPDGEALFWRLLVVAEPGSRFSLIEDLSIAGPRRSRATRTQSSSSSSARRPRSSTSRSRTSRARRGTSPRTARASGATPSSTGSRAASARRRARCGSRTTSPARARPRA